MKNKFLKVVLTIALFLLVGAVIYIMIANKASFDEAVDLIFVGVGGVGTAVMMFLPLVEKVNKASVSTSVQNDRSESLMADFEAMQKKFKEQQEEFSEIVQSQKTEIAELKSEIKNLTNICKMGFVNNKELVSKGVASEIAKVGEADENNESKE